MGINGDTGRLFEAVDQNSECAGRLPCHVVPDGCVCPDDGKLSYVEFAVFMKAITDK
jgi:hypothetical protein